MYDQLKDLPLHNQIEYLTKILVQMKSHNGTEGEKEKGDFLYKAIQSFPYFKENPINIWKQTLEEGKRVNVFAFVESIKKSNKTIIFHAHIDTVGIDDYGSIKEIAHSPDKLQTYFSTYKADAEAQQDALSGEWMFGRGALDMQSGISIHLANLLYYSSNRVQLEGNILVLFNMDEENQHIGIRGALYELSRLKAEKNLQFIAAINNDFISPLYEGDSNKYIYCGGAGKLLPCFSIFGREAHVGESLVGLDPTLIGSEINRVMNQNFSLAEALEGELVLPPSCLYFKENKSSYDVQTPVSLRMYFNYFIYKATPAEVLEKLKEIAVKASGKIEKELADHYQAYRLANNLPERVLDWKTEVLTLQEYIDQLKEKQVDPEKRIIEVLAKTRKEITDDRMIAFEMVEALQNLDPEKKPRVIIFFAPPFLPSNTLQNDERSIELKQIIANVLESSGEKYKESFSLRNYFPYLCDGSFLAFHGNAAEIETIKANFPGMDQLFPLALEEMKELNIPALNIGVYGKGGHKWTERVYKPYSFHTLPLIIREVTEKLLTVDR
ncbi:M20/M25/M40 family metallo-hydrolase [Niallia sp. 01092]|uniref:M20/M25/M40 family metallo-hydrolase n=1 Tax=unclassified Niallia TaxID=2837522 RepID=UPI003FD19434